MISVCFLENFGSFDFFQIFQRMCGFSQLPSGTLRNPPESSGSLGRFPPEPSGSLRNFFATLPGKVNKSQMRPTPKKPFPPEPSGTLRNPLEPSGTLRNHLARNGSNFTKNTILMNKNFFIQENQFFQKTNKKHKPNTFCLFPPEPSGTIRNPSENSRNTPGITEVMVPDTF